MHFIIRYVIRFLGPVDTTDVVPSGAINTATTSSTALSPRPSASSETAGEKCRNVHEHAHESVACVSQYHWHVIIVHLDTLAGLCVPSMHVWQVTCVCVLIYTHVCIRTRKHTHTHTHQDMPSYCTFTHAVTYVQYAMST